MKSLIHMKIMLWSLIHLTAAMPFSDRYDNHLFLRQDTCTQLTTDISMIGSSGAAAIYATTGGITAVFVCRQNGQPDCNLRGAVVAGVMLSIFTLIGQIKGGAFASSAAPATGAVASRSLGPMHKRFISAYNESNGFSYESITDTTSTVLEGLPKRDNQAAFEHTSIRGLRIPGNNQSMNFNHVDFGDGNGHFEIPNHLVSPGTHLDRRDHSGFKVSYTTRLASGLTDAHKQLMSSLIGAYWADTVNQGSVANMMGFVKTADAANFYWRIIPETVAFGLNYESVDICGGMAGFL